MESRPLTRAIAYLANHDGLQGVALVALSKRSQRFVADAFGYQRELKGRALGTLLALVCR